MSDLPDLPDNWEEIIKSEEFKKKMHEAIGDHDGHRGFANISRNYFWWGCSKDCPACKRERNKDDQAKGK